jgi:ribosomal RNA-processing protein 8
MKKKSVKKNSAHKHKVNKKVADLVKKSYGEPTETIAKQSQGPTEGVSDSLSGSRFRWLNDSIYKRSGHETFQQFQKEPGLFDAYHQGFRDQVEKWPTDPVNDVISFLSTRPLLKTIADFGCGEAKIGRSDKLRDKTILNFDLISKEVEGVKITACDITGEFPLEDESIDCAVFCLSLMGTNWPRSISEAYRCLKTRTGTLVIVEVASRLTVSERGFGRKIELAGFKRIRTDIVKQEGDAPYFQTFCFKKIHLNKPKALNAQLLKPCQYKKR